MINGLVREMQYRGEMIHGCLLLKCVAVEFIVMRLGTHSLTARLCRHAIWVEIVGDKGLSSEDQRDYERSHSLFRRSLCGYLMDCIIRSCYVIMAGIS